MDSTGLKKPRKLRPMTMGEKIEQMMQERGFRGPQAFAAAVGTSKSTLGRWIKGEAIPNRFHLLAMAKVLKVSLEYLADDEVTDPTPPVRLTPMERKILDLATDLGLDLAHLRLLGKPEPKIPPDKPHYGDRREGEGE